MCSPDAGKSFIEKCVSNANSGNENRKRDCVQERHNLFFLIRVKDGTRTRDPWNHNPML